MRTFTTSIVISVALLGFAACDSKVKTARKVEELDRKAVIAHRDAKIFAKQAVTDAEVAKVRIEAERKEAETIRDAIQKASKDPEGKVSEPGKEK